jgi:hypothetical protein
LAVVAGLRVEEEWGDNAVPVAATVGSEEAGHRGGLAEVDGG